MACMDHNWFFETPCPRCPPTTIGQQRALDAVLDMKADEIAAAEDTRIVAEVTAAVTEPYVEPPLPENPDPLDIPAVLQRRPGGWKYPSLHGAVSQETGTPTRDTVAGSEAGTAPPNPRDMSDAELHRASYAEMSAEDRQPFLRELRRREDTAASRARIAKLKASKGLT